MTLMLAHQVFDRADLLFGGWGFYNFNHHEPKAPTATLKPKEECAYCHIANAKKDEVWTQFYRLLDR